MTQHDLILCTLLEGQSTSASHVFAWCSTDNVIFVFLTSTVFSDYGFPTTHDWIPTSHSRSAVRTVWSNDWRRFKSRLWIHSDKGFAHVYWYQQWFTPFNISAHRENSNTEDHLHSTESQQSSFRNCWIWIHCPTDLNHCMGASREWSHSQAPRNRFLATDHS